MDNKVSPMVRGDTHPMIGQGGQEGKKEGVTGGRCVLHNVLHNRVFK